VQSSPPNEPSASGQGFDRQPPVSLEAEVAVLGGLLNDPDAFARVMETIDDSMFFREAHRRIFRAASRLFTRGEVADVITVGDELRNSGELDSAGGLPYLAELLEAVPTAANIQYHARIVQSKALLRRLIDASSQIIRDVYEQTDRPVEDVLDGAEQRIFQVAQSHDRGGFVRIKQILRETFERIEHLQESGGPVIGVPTGFKDLDRMTAGLHPGDLVIVAARPSMGKTSWVLNAAQNAAIDHQVPVAIFSLEMSKEQLVQRFLCAEGRVDAGHLKIGRLSSDEMQRLARAAGLLNLAPIWIDDSPGSTVLEMRAKARRLKTDENIGMLVIDYLQLMSGGGRGSDSRTQEVSEISRGLKALARELAIPVIALSQLSRGPESRQDKRPMLSDLRESGSIEQDADIVMFLFREEYYLRPEEVDEKGLAGKAELLIAKHRNGPTGVVDLFFHKAYTRFDDMAPEPEGQGAGYGGGYG